MMRPSHQNFPPLSSRAGFGRARSGRARSARAAFTLIEMLTVIGIIILVLSITIPVINTLSGNRSVAAAQNQVASMLATARADAMFNRQNGGVGVMFFPDPATGQTAMAEVMQIPSNIFTLPPPPIFGVGVSSTIASLPANVNTVSNGSVGQALEMVFTLDQKNKPVYYRDIVLLPKGVSIALANNYSWNGTPNLVDLDRYVRIGVIMFDTQGNVASIPYGVWHQTELGKRFLTQQSKNNLVSCVSKALIPPVPLMSQVGFVLYDHDQYISQRTKGQVQFNDSDLEYQVILAPGLTLQPVPQAGLTPSSPSQKVEEDNWLEQNGVPLVVSPFNGALIKAK